MTPFANQYVSQEEMNIYEVIVLIVRNMRDIDLGRDEDGKAIVLSCHMLARAIGKIFNLKIVDGYYHHGYEHSWLVTPSGHIIDVYPVGMIGGPLICIGGRFSPFNSLYKAQSAKRISAGRFSRPSFRRSLRMISAEIVRTAKEIHS